MTTRPRLVATDLDGTLLRSDGTLSERTRSALQAADSAGITVVFVTARPPRWLPELTDAVAGHGHVICLGGACILDIGSGRVVESTGFTHGAAHALVAELRAAIPEVALAAERIDGPVYDPGFLRPTDHHPPGLSDTASAVAHEGIENAWSHGTDWPVAKLLARAAALATEELLSLVTDVVGDRAHLAYSGAVGLAELLPREVTKASALARWCAREGVAPADVWAFGDMPNDLPMLRWAGRSFAMANAHASVQQAVTDIAEGNDDDGVAQVLETVLGG